VWVVHHVCLQAKSKRRKERSKLVFKRSFVLAGLPPSSVFPFMFDVLNIMCVGRPSRLLMSKKQRGERSKLVRNIVCFG